MSNRAKTAAFYVSPGGCDSNDGRSPRQAFATIHRAATAVRELTGGMRSDIVVELAGGTYVLDSTVRLDARDGGNGHSVIYRAAAGARPVLSGGRTIGGWKKVAHPAISNLWAAAVPDLPSTRQLYVNGRAAAMARGANLNPRSQDGAEADFVFQNQIETAISNGNETPVYEGYTTAAFSQMSQWRNPWDIEFVYDVVWTRVILPVEKVTTDGSRAFVKMKTPAFRDAQIKDGMHIDGPDFIQNAYELLGTPGQWYHDRSKGVLYYTPLEGEDMASAVVIVPVLETLLEVRGKLEEPVRNIRFEGLTFSYTTFLRPRTLGHAEIQANFLKNPAVDVDHTSYLKTPGGVVLDAAHNVCFHRCTFSHMGAGAMDIQNGSQGNVVRGCLFTQTAAGAIQIGDVQVSDAHPDDPRTIVSGNIIDNCRLVAIGTEFKGSIGIFVGYAAGTVITHNEISDVGYTGISVGWGWGYYDPWTEPDKPKFYRDGCYRRFDKPTTCRDTLVEHNHVHHVLSSLNDGGGIYTLGLQIGAVIRENHVHDNGAGRGGPGGLYLDEGSAGMEIVGNVIYNVRRPYRLHLTMPRQQWLLNEHDNYFGIAPTDERFPRLIATSAGLEEEYRDLLG
ncbi:MAG: right-handed parallel beta-helix repeat-containing protein [Planctomycetaceae bacterium]|nr:right-handed parallel beta-helix repeat-containing protein [Planctomycetaceae bacterium]